MISYELKDLPLEEKFQAFFKPTKPVPYAESKTKVNLQTAQVFAPIECYREQLVSWLQFLPLVTDQVQFHEADYILFMHPYARCEDLSGFCFDILKDFAKHRKDGSKIVVCGKSANLQEKAEAEGIENLIFYKSNYAREVGKLLNVDIQDQFVVYDEKEEQLNIWPVDGCKQHCGFCRRCYMDIPFESQSLEFLKEKLDWFKQHHPEQMKKISLRAENLTEYGLDLYGSQRLPDVISLINSYDEVKEINLDIGMNIGEITDEILDSLNKCKKIKSIYMNFEAGTNRLLKLINKAHTVERAKYVAKSLREANPAIKICSTVMIGLPTETLTDVHALADLISDVYIDQLLINYYIPAEGHTLPKEGIPQGRLKSYHLEELLDCLGDVKFPTTNKAINNSSDLHPSMEIFCYDGYNHKKASRRSYIRKQEKLDRENQERVGDFPGHYEKHFKILHYQEKQRRLAQKAKNDKATEDIEKNN